MTLLVDTGQLISYIIMMKIVLYLECGLCKPVRCSLSRLCSSLQAGCYHAVLHKILQAVSEFRKGSAPLTST
jgi:hypothetical protein